MHHDNELVVLMERIAGLGARASIAPPPVQAPAAPMAKPLRVERVKNAEEAGRAIAEARPGTRVLLADGTYAAGKHYWSPGRGKGGTVELPVEIMAENPGKAVIAGADAALAAPGMLVFGLRFKTRLNLRPGVDRLSVLGNWFEGADGIRGYTGKHWLIGYNSFTGNSPNGNVRRDHIVFLVPDQGPDIPEHGRIFRNWFSDTNRRQTAENHFVYFGQTDKGYDRTPSFKNVVIHHNLAIGERRRGFYVKRGLHMIGNHVELKRGTNGYRWGEGGRFWGNRMTGSLDAVVNGRDHDIRGNFIRASNGFQLMSQHLSRTNNRYVAADRAKVIGNDAELIVGEIGKGGKLQKPVEGVYVERHVGRLILVKRAQVGTKVVKDAAPRAGLVLPEDFEDVPAVTLHKAQVGPWAWPGAARLYQPWPEVDERDLELETAA